MPEQTSPTTAQPCPGPRAPPQADMRREVRRMHAGVLLFYLIDAVLLGLFGLCGTVPQALGLWYGLAGLVATEAAFLHFRQRGARSAGLETLCLASTASAGVVMLATLAHAPRLGGLLLMSMMAVLALSATQLSRQRQLGLCVLLAVASVALLACTHGGAGVPTASAAECVLSAVWLAWLMAKASAHNITGTRLREQVKRANGELASALQTLEQVAATDELTRLPNRRAILAGVQQAVLAGQQQGGAVALALLDIDHFKRVNDQHGHAAGDQVLRSFGRLVALGLRPGDQVGRYGGEEFLLVLRLPAQQFDDTGAAADVVQRLCAAVAQHDWSGIARGLAITASAGVTLWLPGEDAASAIRRADALLYDAKAQGRNRVVAAGRPVMPLAPAATRSAAVRA